MAKRLTTSSVNWSFIMDTLPADDVAKLATLKSLFDKYLRELSYKPMDLPKIDWNFYKSKIHTPGMVDSFQKSYESLKIPYPSDQGVLADTEKCNSNLIKFANASYETLLEDIKNAKEKLAKLESVMKYSDMTCEEYVLAKNLKVDLKNTPYFKSSSEDK